MILKVFRGVWFISLLGVVANLMWVYAGLPENVVIHEEGVSQYVLNKEILFYSWLGIIGVINLMIYVFGKPLTPDEGFRSWFTGLIINLNVFLVVSMSFIGLYNSTEKFDFSQAGIVIYIVLGLVGIWLTSWLVVVLVRKISS
ncbi:MAG: hypothetical protein KF687_12135 [Cyclobacteriaceae bacterium]|nr:hypothetical protein [Cyclobacteriaceae bacterium]